MYVKEVKSSINVTKLEILGLKQKHGRKKMSLTRCASTCFADLYQDKAFEKDFNQLLQLYTARTLCSDAVIRPACLGPFR